jgi:hypothetical protein
MSDYHDALSALGDMLSRHDPRRPMVRKGFDWWKKARHCPKSDSQEKQKGYGHYE